jgi:hypothetical protein
MRRNRIVTAALILVGAAAVLGWISRETQGADISAPGLSTPFKIARMPEVATSIVKVAYNPNSDRYIVFILVRFSEKLSRIFTRLYKADGRPAGGLRRALEVDGAAQTVDVAYNPKDDRFLAVASIGYLDAIKAAVFDGQGGLVENQPVIEIKPEGEMYSGFAARAAWIEKTNQYAVAWSSWNPNKLSDPANGHYLAVLNSDFSFKIKGKQVRQQACPAHALPYLSILHVGDKILWGTSEAVGANGIKPVAWFTRPNGAVLTGYGKNGFIYPGQTVEMGALVVPVYDAVHKRFLLYWNVADSPYSYKQTYNKNYFRIMDDRGVFKSPTAALPQKTAFQRMGQAIPNSEEGRFFFVAPEYQVLDHGQTFHYGMKLWGFYIDYQGHIVDKNGKIRTVSYPLTAPILDHYQIGSAGNSGFSPEDNSYFISYAVEDMFNRYIDCLGIIYK